MNEDAIEAVLAGLVRWHLCKTELDRCVREAHYEAGYFCSDYRDVERKAREQFGAALTALIDARIAKSHDEATGANG